MPDAPVPDAPMESGTHVVDLNKAPISFTIDPTPEQLPYIVDYIGKTPKVFNARSSEHLVQLPPRLVQQLQAAVELELNCKKGEANALNRHILQGMIPPSELG